MTTPPIRPIDRKAWVRSAAISDSGTLRYGSYNPDIVAAEDAITAMMHTAPAMADDFPAQIASTAFTIMPLRGYNGMLLLLQPQRPNLLLMPYACGLHELRCHLSSRSS